MSKAVAGLTNRSGNHDCQGLTVLSKSYLKVQTISSLLETAEEGNGCFLCTSWSSHIGKSRTLRSSLHCSCNIRCLFSLTEFVWRSWDPLSCRSGFVGSTPVFFCYTGFYLLRKDTTVNLLKWGFLEMSTVQTVFQTNVACAALSVVCGNCKVYLD